MNFTRLVKQKGNKMTRFKFSVGPWNIHEGTDAFGPEIRPSIPLEEKIKKFSEIGFSAVQFHDDDAVPNINDLSEDQIKTEASEIKKLLDKYGMKAEFVAPAATFMIESSTHQDILSLILSRV